MATELSREVMRRLARLGAERRLEELRQEEASIRAAFPELGAVATGRRGRRAGRSAATESLSAPVTSTKQAKTKTPRRPRRKMSAAEKKAVSERMRKYWAARRKAEG